MGQGASGALMPCDEECKAKCGEHIICVSPDRSLIINQAYEVLLLTLQQVPSGSDRVNLEYLGGVRCRNGKKRLCKAMQKIT